MDFSAIGQKIKELRKQMKLSQEELAEGICTQAQISKIEKGDVYPYASTLYLISQRLGVDVNYFFDIGMTPRLDYVQEVTHQLKLARRSMDMDEMHQIVKAEENNPLFIQNKKNQQLLWWHKGIYEYEKKKNLDKAIEIIEAALSLTSVTDKAYSEREIELILTIAIFYIEENKYMEAREKLLLCKEQMNSLPYVSDKTIKTRLLYNSARIFTRLEEYDESVSSCQEAIKWCLEQDSLYLFGDLHYHLGYNYELQEDYGQAYFYMNKAYFIFELQHNTRYLHFIQSKLKKWKNVVPY